MKKSSSSVKDALRDVLKLVGVIAADADPCDPALVKAATIFLKHPSPLYVVRIGGKAVTACPICGTEYVYDPKQAETICPSCSHVVRL